MKLQEGDYVDVRGMDVDQRIEVVQALIDCGAGIGEWFSCVQNLALEKIGIWNQSVYYGFGGGKRLNGRKLTLSDLRGETPEWNGEGLPTIGCKCEVVTDFGEWYECEILAHHNGKAVMYCEPWGDYDYWAYPAKRFRPIKSEARSLADVANIGIDAAQRVLDAGYRKVEK